MEKCRVWISESIFQQLHVYLNNKSIDLDKEQHGAETYYSQTNALYMYFNNATFLLTLLFCAAIFKDPWKYELCVPLSNIMHVFLEMCNRQ